MRKGEGVRKRKESGKGRKVQKKIKEKGRGEERECRESEDIGGRGEK